MLIGLMSGNTCPLSQLHKRGSVRSIYSTTLDKVNQYSTNALRYVMRFILAFSCYSVEYEYLGIRYEICSYNYSKSACFYKRVLYIKIIFVIDKDQQ